MPDNNRLVAVDGLRGVAAICVVLMHAHISILPVPRGYLAVDFFFVLSGYVIARSYEPRFAAGLGVGEYAWARIERLYPLLLIGSATGVAAWLAGYSEFVPTGPADLVRALVGQFAMIPFLSTASSLAFDAALWSISFELLANIAHASIYPWLATRRLPLLIGVSFLLLAFMGHRYGSLNIGWHRQSALGGLGRVMFGFFVGVLLWRTEAWWRPRTPRLPFALICLVLIAVVNAPLAGRGSGLWGTLYDLGIVALAMPLLVICGVRANGAGHFALSFGVLSFPVYAVHVPLVDAMRLAGWHDGMRIGGVAAIAAIAWLIGRHVDEPLNAWRRASRKRVAACKASALQQPAT
jgi:peptidoglycan/LPS O-acetylase OafA/YrhL